MKIKTSELMPPALDGMVAKCQGVPVYFEGRLWDSYPNESQHPYEPSTDWSQGGPIIERECIAIYASGACSIPPKNPDYWVAEILATDEMVTGYGPTPLITAMRCYVASKMGDEVEVPEELCHGQ